VARRVVIVAEDNLLDARVAAEKGEDISVPGAAGSDVIPPGQVGVSGSRLQGGIAHGVDAGLKDTGPRCLLAAAEIKTAAGFI